MCLVTESPVSHLIFAVCGAIGITFCSSFVNDSTWEGSESYLTKTIGKVLCMICKSGRPCWSGEKKAGGARTCLQRNSAVSTRRVGDRVLRTRGRQGPGRIGRRRGFGSCIGRCL